jgi:hypothetical protein
MTPPIGSRLPFSLFLSVFVVSLTWPAPSAGQATGQPPPAQNSKGASSLPSKTFGTGTITLGGETRTFTATGTCYYRVDDKNFTRAGVMMYSIGPIKGYFDEDRAKAEAPRSGAATNFENVLIGLQGNWDPPPFNKDSPRNVGALSLAAGDQVITVSLWGRPFLKVDTLIMNFKGGRIRNAGGDYVDQEGQGKIVPDPLFRFDGSTVRVKGSIAKNRSDYHAVEITFSPCLPHPKNKPAAGQSPSGSAPGGSATPPAPTKPAAKPTSESVTPTEMAATVNDQLKPVLEAALGVHLTLRSSNVRPVGASGQLQVNISYVVDGGFPAVRSYAPELTATVERFGGTVQSVMGAAANPINGMTVIFKEMDIGGESMYGRLGGVPFNNSVSFQGMWGGKSRYQH